MASRIKRPKHFKLESDLCAAFVAAIADSGWTAYAETAGWDLLLVRKEDDFQIGIQAKLKLNAFVLAQTLDQYDAMSPGPDCRAVLVPEGEESVGLQYLCAFIGITIIRMRAPREKGSSGYGNYAREPFSPALPGLSASTEHRARDWFEQCPTARCTLPEYVPDVIAGGPAPLQLTDWKIRAIKIAVLLEANGYLTRKDFAHVKIDHRRWLTGGMGWLIVKDGHYVASKFFPNFRKQHPIVYEQIKADLLQWMPKTREPEAGQPALL